MNRILALFLVAVFSAAFSASYAQENQRETPVVKAVRKAGPAVVGVSAITEREGGSPFAGIDPFFDRFFRDFFGDLPGVEESASLGSGVLIDDKGHVLTNEHVIHGATEITVTFVGGEEAKALLVGADAATDLAVLRIDTKKSRRPVDIGRSSDLMIGETVIAIGNPFGLAHTVTTGVVSAVGRTVQGGDKRTYTDFIQTDASINPGNSGGPLLNILGELVGINAAIYQSAEGIGFAIPIDKARKIYADLIAYGEVRHAFIGVQVQEVDDEMARYMKMENPYGVAVRRVFEESPAEEAGIKSGDVILAVDGAKIGGRADYIGKMAGYTTDGRIAFKVLRKGSERTITVNPRTMPTDYYKTLSRSWLGVKAARNSEKMAQKYGLSTTRGMVVTEVVKKSPAESTGIQPGDVIRTINDEPVDNEEGFGTAVLSASQRETLVLLVQRGRVGYHVSLTP